MGRIVISGPQNVSLDGVVQDPDGKECFSRCGWVIEFGNGRGVIHCGEPSKPGASFGYCTEHNDELLECHWPDGSPRR